MSDVRSISDRIAIADLTPAYAKHARRVERGVAMLHRHSVLVQDEIETRKAAAVRWSVHTPAAVALSDDSRTATLRDGGESLTVGILAPEKVRFEVRDSTPFRESPDPPGQHRNDRIRKLAIHLPQATSARLAVLFASAGAAAKEDAPIRPLAQW
jgi:hypothetical protein